MAIMGNSGFMEFATAVNKLDESTQIDYVSIATLAGINIGVSTNQWWVLWWEAAEGQRAVEYTPGTDCVWLTPLLELTPPDVKSALSAGLSKRNMDEELLKRFPVEDLVVTGLRWPTEHVVLEALAWAAGSSSPRIMQQVSDLVALGPSAATRKFAKQILKAQQR